MKTRNSLLFINFYFTYFIFYYLKLFYLISCFFYLIVVFCLQKFYYTFDDQKFVGNVYSYLKKTVLPDVKTKIDEKNKEAREAFQFLEETVFQHNNFNNSRDRKQYKQKS